MKKSRRGRSRCFTLIELLMVVSIIAILAAMAVPNFLEAQVRTKTARVRSDMAVVAAALRAYQADHNQFPPNNSDLKGFLQYCAERETVDSRETSTPASALSSWSAQDPMAASRPGNWSGSYQFPYPILQTSGRDLEALTSPVAYVGRVIPEDPYCPRYDSYGRSQVSPPGYDRFTYINLTDLAFADPARRSAADTKRFALVSAGPDREVLAPPCPNPVNGPFVYYDPTNGAVSKGDLFQWGNWREVPESGDIFPTPPGTKLPPTPYPNFPGRI